MAKRILHITISLLLLVATSGVTISKHYCGDDLIRIAINTKADSCCSDDNCDNCSTDSEWFKNTEDFITSATPAILDQEVLATAVSLISKDIFNTIDQPASIEHFSKSPPDINRHIPVLISQFLL